MCGQESPGPGFVADNPENGPKLKPISKRLSVQIRAGINQVAEWIALLRWVEADVSSDDEFHTIVVVSPPRNNSSYRDASKLLRHLRGSSRRTRHDRSKLPRLDFHDIRMRL